MDIRQYINDQEEAFRIGVQGELKKVYVAMPVIVDETSKDGHTVKLKMAVKGIVTDKNGKKKYEEYPTIDMAPIHYMGGGGVTITHPAAEKDEGIAIVMSRPQDTWHKEGDVQDPIDHRMFSLSDARYLPGGRSDPRKLKNVSDKAAHIRSDDGKHTFEQHPEKGMTAKSVHPDDKAEDPFKDAERFHSQSIIGEVGYANESVDKRPGRSKRHAHTLKYDEGHVLDANNGKHKTEIHPDQGVKSSADDGKHVVEVKSGEGASISTDNGQHKVEAKSGQGVNVESSQKIKLQAPQTSVSQDLEVGQMIKAPQAQFGLAAIGGIMGMGGGALNGGGGANSGIGAGAMQTGAAAQNVGELGGDLDGTLPEPKVVGCLNISDAHRLKDCADDMAAMNAGVLVGHLYRTGSILKVRVS